MVAASTTWAGVMPAFTIAWVSLRNENPGTLNSWGASAPSMIRPPARAIPASTRSRTSISLSRWGNGASLSIWFLPSTHSSSSGMYSSLGQLAQRLGGGIAEQHLQTAMVGTTIAPARRVAA